MTICFVMVAQETWFVKQCSAQTGRVFNVIFETDREAYQNGVIVHARANLRTNTNCLVQNIVIHRLSRTCPCETMFTSAAQLRLARCGWPHRSRGRDKLIP